MAWFAPEMPKWEEPLSAVVLGVAGLLINYGVFSLGVDAILLVGAGFVLLALASAIDGL